MNSRNHHMFSSISAWMVQNVGGITSGQASEQPLELLAASSTSVSSCDTELQTCHGDVSFSYQRTGGTQCLKMATPVQPRLGEATEFELSCGEQGGIISKIEFASWGQPTGDCGNFSTTESCHASDALSLVKALCLGKTSCMLPSTSAAWSHSFSSVGCTPSDPKSLFVQARCSVGHGLFVEAKVPVGAQASLLLPLEESVQMAGSAFTLTEAEAGLVVSAEKVDSVWHTVVMPPLDSKLGVSVSRQTRAGVEVLVDGRSHVRVQLESGNFAFKLTTK